MILTPYVKVIKDKYYNGCVPTAVSVLTAAAPIIKTKWAVSDNYETMMRERIDAVLLCAAYHGYTHLVLGAWGCGAFGNEPSVIARLFREAIEDFSYNGKNVHQLFEKISFAVPYNEKRPINYLTFKGEFND